MASQTAAEPRPPINYIFVDFENVSTGSVSVIGSKTVHFTLLVGASQKKLDVDLVKKLIEHAASVQLVRLTSAGKNSLDFAVAYYLGKAVSTHPGAYFHIISKDKGFDPLIEHLKTRHINVRRHPDFASLSFSHPSKASGEAPVGIPSPAPGSELDDLLARAVNHLRKNSGNRPKRRKTLATHLSSLLEKSASNAEARINKLITQLEKGGHVSIGDNETVSYHLNRK